MVSHVERNKLITWARDQYVSQEMRAGRGVGAAGRKDLKRKYAAMEPVEKPVTCRAWTSLLSCKRLPRVLWQRGLWSLLL